MGNLFPLRDHFDLITPLPGRTKLLRTYISLMKWLDLLLFDKASDFRWHWWWKRWQVVFQLWVSQKTTGCQLHLLVPLETEQQICLFPFVYFCCPVTSKSRRSLMHLSAYSDVTAGFCSCWLDKYSVVALATALKLLQMISHLKVESRESGVNLEPEVPHIWSKQHYLCCTNAAFSWHIVLLCSLQFY